MLDLPRRHQPCITTSVKHYEFLANPYRGIVDPFPSKILDATASSLSHVPVYSGGAHSPVLHSSVHLTVEKSSRGCY